MFQRVMFWVIGGLVFEEGEGMAQELVFDGEQRGHAFHAVSSWRWT